MEQKRSETIPSFIPRYGFYLFFGLVVLGIVVYLYMRKMANDVKRDIEEVYRSPMEMETDEQIEEKILEIQKYLVQHPQE